LSQGIGATAAKGFLELMKSSPLPAARQQSVMIVNDPYHDPRFNKMVDYQTGYKTKSVLAVPVVSASGSLHGVLQLVNKHGRGFTPEDGSILLSFANLAGDAFESEKASDLRANGAAQIEMMRWISELEYESCEIPSRLRIQQSKIPELECREFNVLAWNGIGLFKIVFQIFHQYSLLHKFQVTNSLFFTFLYRLREKYYDNAFHNWLHAVDVLQFVSFAIQCCQLTDKLTALELFGIFIAMLAHDVGHRGLDNRFLASAGDPHGILYKDFGSINEFQHCSILIEVVSFPRANIFHAFVEAETRALWTLIVKVILATDFGTNPKIIRTGNDLLDEGPINLTNTAHRLLALRLLGMMADLSNVLRTFEIAQEWSGMLQDEISKQAQMEQVDKKGPDTPALFLENTGIPLLLLVSRIFPELDELITVARDICAKWRGETKKPEESTKGASPTG
jgi:hypothetical protein